MQSRYDAIVVGAGPAGATAAFYIAKAGHSVLLVEKHKIPGRPLCCAEAVSRPSFEKIHKPRKEWVSTYISKVRLAGPHGSEVIINQPDAGFILERPVFDNDLVLMAMSEGCELKCEAIGLHLNKKDDLFDSLDILDTSGEVTSVRAGIFIAADGVESKIARLAGINNLLDIDDVESILQYRIENIEVDPETIELHIGNEVAPGGYAWVFPKSGCSANVGIGIMVNGNRGHLCRDLLDRFIARRFDHPKVIFKSSGVTPKYSTEDLYRRQNLLVAGDAARALDSLSGAGIVNALLSGKYAGLAAAKYLSDDISAPSEIERYYPGRFLRLKRDELMTYKKLRKVYIHLNDNDFVDIIKALSEHCKEGRLEGIHPARLLVKIVRTRPRLLHLVRYLL